MAKTTKKWFSDFIFLAIAFSSANGQAPAVSCPRDTVPYREATEVKKCIPDDKNACPDGFFCNYDGLDDRYICCGKPPGYCDAGKVYIDPKTEEPKECRIDKTDDCSIPYYCRSRNSGSKTGYCCLMVDEQEPPPVGCPWGTRPLKDANNQALTCTPGRPGACPGTSICYFDSVEKTNKCCGRDPGEGCPSGSKAVKNGNSVVPCTPGDTTTPCPGSAICQWSYLIDRYQCCESDAGCPTNMVPLLDSTGQARTCTQGSNTCGIGYSCEFNFWIASYQCCGQDRGACPANTVAYIELATGLPRICSSATIGACPAGYSCSVSTTNQNVCCGPVGQCPAGQTLVTDAQNRAQSCSPTVPNSCTAPARCQLAIGGVVGQYLCCQLGTINQCPSGRTPYPTISNPQQCNLGLPNSCPAGSTCEATALSGLRICCATSSGSGNCPSGWTLQNNFVSFCVPTNPTCISGSSCLASTTQTGQYICCTPSTSGTYTCPTGTPLRIGNAYQFCNQFSPNCPSSSTCQQASNRPGTFICCTNVVSTYTCPIGTPVLNGGSPIFCSTAADTICPSRGATCRATVQSPTTSICCSNSGSTYTCPVGTPVMAGTVPQYCSITAPNCPVGASCMSTTSLPAMTICCRTSGTAAQYTCPNNMVPQRVGTSYQFCSIAAPTCGSGSTCQAALNVVGIYICCIGSGTGQYYCPLNAAPYRVGLQYSFCSLAAPTCPPGYTCQQSTNVPGTYICCSSSAGTLYTCPNNAVPYRVGTTTPTCVITSPNCPNGYTCQRSANVATNIYICCPAGATTAPTCPNNGQPQRVGLNYQYCSSGQPCQSPYTCQAATNLANTFVCCTSSTSSTYTCPINYTPYLQNGQPIFCNRVSPINCPGGTVCLQSVNAPQYQICCQSGTQSNLCPNNQVALLVGTSPQVCTGPGQACPQVGYTCQVSPTLGQYICCGGSATTTRCLNNQPMYQPSGQMFYCSPQNPTVCPANYLCQQSTTANQYVCCSTGVSVTASSCISGRIPYRPAGSILTCTGNTAICPSGTICEQSNVPSQQICCSVQQLTSLQCPTGWQPFLLSGNVPQSCTGFTDRSCPSGYSCTQASGVGTGRYLCCRYGVGTTLRCYNSLLNPYLDASNQPQYCSTLAPTCPSGYSCQASTQSGTTPVLCLDGTPPYALTGGTVQYCYAPGTTTGCPSGYTCQTSSQPSYNVCCNSVNNRGICPGSTPLIGANGQATVCNIFSNNCPTGYTCTQSTGSLTYVCCRTIGQAVGARCIGRGTYLSASNPISCQLPNTCPGGYECSAYTTTGQYICCNVARDANQPVCPGGSEPYHDPVTKEFHYCSNTGYACPEGFLCKKRLNSLQAPDQHICCSSKPMCQRGWLPYLNTSTLQPQKCSPYETNSCNPPGQPYKCQQSTVPSQYICCMESLISMENDRKTNKTVKPPAYPFDDFEFSNSLTTTPVTTRFTTRPHEVEDFDYVWGDDGTVHAPADDTE